MAGRKTVVIRQAAWPADLAATQSLLREYFNMLATDPQVPEFLRAKNRAPELASVPTHYDQQSASLLLACSDRTPLGCTAVHMLAEREHSAELKRLYVRPAARGMQVGTRLVGAAAAWARERGAKEILLDTLPAAMPAAVRLYRSVGFQPITCYNVNREECFAFFRLDLQ